MDNREWIDNIDEKLEASNEERKILTLRVNSLSSTTTFTFDTLSQHRSLVNQLQDEVYFLHHKLVSLQEQTTQKNEEPHNSNSVAESTEGKEEKVGILPYLNVLVGVEEEHEQSYKSLETTTKSESWQFYVLNSQSVISFCRI